MYIHSFIHSFIYLWLCWVFVSVRGLSLVVASGGHSSSRCAGLSLLRPLLLQSTGSRRAGSVIVAHGPSRSAACGILPDQGSNPCPLHWQADSQPLRHQGSPTYLFLPHSLWDLSSPTRHWTLAHAVKVQSPDHWNAMETFHITLLKTTHFIYNSFSCKDTTYTSHNQFPLLLTFNMTLIHVSQLMN